VSVTKTGRNTVEIGTVTKTCTKCGETKEAGEFRRNRRMRDGLSSWCAGCHCEADRRYREQNRDRINEVRRVVPRYIYDAVMRATVPNPSPRPKSKVW
jgi:hypothetical protein